MKTFKLWSLLVVLAVLGCNGNAVSNVGGMEEPKPSPEQPKPEQKKLPAKLSVQLSAPKTVSVGQTFFLDVTVTHGGEAPAQSVSPTSPLQTGLGHAAITAPPSPMTVNLEDNGTHTFRFTLEATDPGALTFEVGADGLDPLNDQSVSAEKTTVSMVVEGSGLLMVDHVTVPKVANVGDDFTVTVGLSNGGQSALDEVAPTLPVIAGSGAATLVSGPTPASAKLAGGAAASFSYTFKATQAGSITVAAGGKAVDERSRVATTTEPLTSSALTLDTPAALEAMVSIPASLSTGQVFTATLVVKNTGTATAKGVVPSPLLPVATASTGNASASTTQSPAAIDIPGGGSASFTWSYTASGTGTLSLTAGATGTDGNSGVAVTAAPAKSNNATVAAPSALVVTALSIPTNINRGSTFTVTMTVRNSGGVALTNVLPNPNPLTATATGGAAATTSSTPAAQNLAVGASATFTWSYTENGTAPGSLLFTGGARGTPTGSTTAINAVATQSNLASVMAPPVLQVESITLPARISRGQAFDVVVTVKNAGGAVANNVLPALSTAATGGASAATATQLVPATVMGGAKAVFTVRYTESGAAPGTLKFSSTASATDGATGMSISAPSQSSSTLTVDAPAELVVSSLSIPATVSRGQTFALSMTVTNAGQATASGVLPVPNPPAAAVTGGVVVATSSPQSAVAIVGGGSQTFTWIYAESGTAAGTVSFTATARGTDLNSSAMVTSPAKTSNVASVATPTGCNGSTLYFGFGGLSLDGDRLDLMPGTDRLRVKPYPVLVTDFNRMLGTTPSYINGQSATFNEAGARWNNEPEMSAVSMYQTLKASFQGCLQYTGTATQYAANPTAATAATQCAAMQQKFWERVPTTAETNACVTFATSAANNDTNPRRRWAYVCASVLTATGFLTE